MTARTAGRVGSVWMMPKLIKLEVIECAVRDDSTREQGVVKSGEQRDEE